MEDGRYRARLPGYPLSSIFGSSPTASVVGRRSWSWWAAGTTYATSRASPGRSSWASTCRRLHLRVPRQRRLDIAKLDPEAAHLHLRVATAQKFQVAVGQVAGAVAGAVQP